MRTSVNQIFNQLQNEGHNIALLDCSNEGDGEVWVAYALNQNEEQIIELKKHLKETGFLIEPAEDIIESKDELYTSLKNICNKNN